VVGSSKRHCRETTDQTGQIELQVNPITTSSIRLVTDSRLSSWNVIAKLKLLGGLKLKPGVVRWGVGRDITTSHFERQNLRSQIADFPSLPGPQPDNKSRTLVLVPFLALNQWAQRQADKQRPGRSNPRPVTKTVWIAGLPLAGSATTILRGGKTTIPTLSASPRQWNSPSPSSHCTATDQPLSLARDTFFENGRWPPIQIPDAPGEEYQRCGNCDGRYQTTTIIASASPFLSSPNTRALLHPNHAAQVVLTSNSSRSSSRDGTSLLSLAANHRRCHRHLP
jgi:hypothetical protein